MKKGSRKQIPLFDLKLSAATRKEVAEVLASGWLTTGPKVLAFEKAVAKLLKVEHAAAVNSATAGLHLALTAIGASPGSISLRGSGPIKEVITSPFTFAATIEAIHHTGAVPVFADIDPHTLTIDPRDVARKITDRTVAVLPVDIAGYPADYYALNKICNRQSIVLISDSAHSISARYHKKTIPNLCDAAVASFYSTKNLTCGEGGMVLSRHKQLVDRVRLLTRHGLTTGTYDRKKQKQPIYDATAYGFKANMSDLHAAIGLGQFKSFKKDQAARNELAGRYLKNLSDLKEYIELPVIEKNYTHGWHLFIIKLHLSRMKINRDEFIAEMARKGIECGVHYKPIFELSWYRDRLNLSPRQFPHAASAGQRVVSLPLYPHLKKTEVDYICENVNTIIRKHSDR